MTNHFISAGSLQASERWPRCIGSSENMMPMSSLLLWRNQSLETECTKILTDPRAADRSQRLLLRPQYHVGVLRIPRRTGRTPSNSKQTQPILTRQWTPKTAPRRPRVRDSPPAVHRLQCGAQLRAFRCYVIPWQERARKEKG